MAGGFAVIKDCPKTLVYALARHRNEVAEQRGERPPIPASVLERAPSAELRPGQRDDDSLPAYSALERVPESLLEASADLGARRWRTIRDIVLPLALPGVVAGSIFTFSLTLGDFITPVLVGGAGSTFIGNVVYANIGIANNVPFAAALSTIPVAIMAVYLLIARRLGAFEAL